MSLKISVKDANKDPLKCIFKIKACNEKAFLLDNTLTEHDCKWIGFTCVHDAVEQSDSHTHRGLSLLPLLYLPTVANSKCAAPYWVACHDGSFNHAVRRAGTHGTCHPTLQSWGGSFSKWPLSICLNANVWLGRFLDYLHLQSRLGFEGISSMGQGTGRSSSLLTEPLLITHTYRGCIVFSILIYSCRSVYMLLVNSKGSKESLRVQIRWYKKAFNAWLIVSLKHSVSVSWLKLYSTKFICMVPCNLITFWHTSFHNITETK